MVATALDDDFRQAERLTRWMPAHTATSSIGSTHDSEGEPITATMWRANRLVDALAKAAAAEHRLPVWVTGWVRNAATLVRHTAATLGAITHAANNYTLSETGPGGEVVTRTIRGSTAVPGRLPYKRGARPIKRKRAATPVADATPALTIGWTPVERQEHGVKARRVHEGGGQRSTPGEALLSRRRATRCLVSSLRQAAQCEGQLGRHLASLELAPAAGPSGTERQAACHARVMARLRQEREALLAAEQ